MKLQMPKLPNTATTPMFDAIDPLDSRYFDPEIAKHFSESSRIVYQAHVESALAQTLAEFKICPKSAANEISKAATKIKPQDVYHEEKTTKHDIKALVNCIKHQVSDKAKPYVHFGATSYDIISTANALQMRQAIDQLVIPRLEALLSTLISLSQKYANTPQIGRTHGQHAVPITFGFTLSEYVSRLGSSILSLQGLTNLLHGKFSGAVGAYNAMSLFADNPIKFETAVLAKLGLKPAPFSTQITPPEDMIRLLDEMTIASGVMANLAHDMRHLQRSEIAEIREKFDKDQTGSSTMAHKRNPCNFENVASLHKQVTSQMMNANLNLISEHQRDLTDSASSRFYSITPACLCVMASRLTKVMERLEVDHQAMERNLMANANAIAAEPLYLLLEKHGHTDAHEKAKTLAHQALEKNIPLARLAASDKQTKPYWNKLSSSEKQVIKNPEKHYAGLAANKTLATVKRWQAIIG